MVDKKAVPFPSPDWEKLALKNKVHKLEIDNKLLKAQVETLKKLIYHEEAKQETNKAFEDAGKE